MTINNIIKSIVFASAILILISGCAIYEKQQKEESTDTSIIQGAVPVDKKSASADKSLNLSNQGLVKLDMSIFERKYLEELDVSNNKLTGALPSQIGNLNNLKILKANNNDFTGVPAELGQLIKLEIIDLSNNKLTGLPNELGQLKNLKVLNIAGNEYSALDLEIIRQNLPNTKFIVN